MVGEANLLCWIFTSQLPLVKTRLVSPSPSLEVLCKGLEESVAISTRHVSFWQVQEKVATGGS